MSEDVSGTSHTEPVGGRMWPQTSGLCLSPLPFGLLPVLTSSLDKLAETSWGTEQPLSSELIEKGVVRRGRPDVLSTDTPFKGAVV